ncbi:MAG: vWA domain-containing protein [Bdellovibrio bacteriovorus]
MPESGFHFAEPAWFWGLLAIIPVALWLVRSATRAARGPIHRYADAHLLPYLTGTRDLQTHERWGRFLRWSLLWALLLAAMAGPRWDATDVRLFHPGNNLLVLLDISRSMQVDDVSPTRLGRARQELQDLIIQNRTVRLGLISFASVPLVLSPITEDTYTILNALPALSTDLVSLQGSRVAMALDRAEALLAGLPEDSAKAILLISDGDFDEPELVERVRKLGEQGIRVHALGIGTPSGGRVPAPRGGWVLDGTGAPVVSTLNESLLQSMAEAGGGVYRLADYRDGDTKAILKAAEVMRLPPEAGDERTRLWNERYWIPVLAVVGLLLPQFRGRPRRRTNP